MPAPAEAFVTEQLAMAPDVPAECALRPKTVYEHSEARCTTASPVLRAPLEEQDGRVVP
ncbi:hypothetical protein HEK616_81500 (plasmid) [Streptomyces nigrescens]|uniref:Uncharacterized protein n=1 Tax=Streptomyces nigrescens TaxID=1920 RepID=A0ABN6RD97_STRNI|nr:hypothetical protein HEK616_81500 [Streptomyces nigrescens]